MKPSKLILATLCLSLSNAFAGTGFQAGGAAIQIDSPAPTMGCICFDGGYLELGAFGSYIFSDNASLDGEPAAGLSLGYFFNEYFGIQGSYSAIFASSTVHDTSGSLVLRYPIRDLCLAPYIYGGGGYAFDAPDQSTGHLGAGLDFRVFEFANCMGFFVDYRYTFADKTNNWQAISAGIKINF